MQAACVAVCVCGVSLGKKVVNVITLAKCALVVFLVVAGFTADRVDIFASSDAFFPEGISGTAKGTSLLFFGFIGFDEVCCLAGRSKDPRRTMPRAIAGTVLGAAIFSGAAQLALAVLGPDPGLTPYDRMQPSSFEKGFDACGWVWARWLVAVGEIALLPVVVLVAFLPQPELFGAMAEDGILPRVFGRKDAAGTFRDGGILSGAFITAIALLMPFSLIWDMTSLGVLLGFNLTNSSLLMFRARQEGSAEAPRRAAPLLAAFWATAAAGSYTFWLLYLAPLLDGGEPSTAGAAVGGALLALSAAITCAFAGCCTAPGRPSPTATGIQHTNLFRAPLVPFTPCAAILVNFMLMAQFDVVAHAYLGCLIAMMLVAYVGHKLLLPAKAAPAKDDAGSLVA